jgi:hypothetical protein
MNLTPLPILTIYPKSFVTSELSKSDNILLFKIFNVKFFKEINYYHYYYYLNNFFY